MSISGRKPIAGVPIVVVATSEYVVLVTSLVLDMKAVELVAAKLATLDVVVVLLEVVGVLDVVVALLEVVGVAVEILGRCSHPSVGSGIE
jgi:hypothetical protein